MKIGIILTSSMVVGDEYINLTRDVAKMMAENNIGVVYGGTEYGMMKELAMSYKKFGGTDLVGVMSKELESVTKNYIVFDKLDEAFWEDKIIERIRKINDLSDGFIILPGGYGALEEMMSVISGKANMLHTKPIIIINYNHYYDSLVQFLKEMFEKKFTKIKLEELVYVCENVDFGIAEYLQNYHQPSLPDKFA